MRPLPPALRARISLVLAIAVLAACYLVAGKFGLSLAFVNASATAVWPPTGIALAALLVFGYRVWPGVFIGAFIVNATTAGSAASSLGIATGNTLEALVAARLVNAFAGGLRAFERPQTVFKFALLAAISNIVSATVGVTSLSLTGYARWADFGPIWFTWWLGDAGGALVVAPVLILWAVAREDPTIGDRAIEKGLLLSTVVVTAVALFGGVLPLSARNYPLAFLSLPALIWAAFRFGPREAATGSLVLGGIADWGTLNGFGPFVRSEQNESLLLLQGFLAVADVTSLALAAAELDRQRAEQRIRATEHRLRMLAEESARVHEEFLAIATHELRTPITSLEGFAQLAVQALDHGEKDRLASAIATIVRQSDRLGSLISRLLDASAIGAARPPVEPTQCDLSTLVAAAVDAARQVRDTHRWVVDVAGPVPAQLDPLRFEQVLTNLLDNAVKFSPKGGAITVRLARRGDTINLEIGDEGIGIAPERIGRIFERFYRAHDDRGIGGLGLGLYVARQIVEQHGGSISVVATPGRGSTFTVTLPAIAGPAAPTAPPLDAADVQVRAPGAGRVLVVDDDADIRNLVREVLRDAGLTVGTASDGQEALVEAAREPPDLILLDKLMPGMDGSAFVRAYRQTNRPAPIIAFCAARDAARWADSIEAVDYVAKPFDVADLERVVLRRLPVTV